MQNRYRTEKELRSPAPVTMFRCVVCSASCSRSCPCQQTHYCSHTCQRLGWPRHKEACVKVQVQIISKEKGRGLVANRNIKTGQVVVEESPFLFIESPEQSSDRSVQVKHERVIQYQKEVLKCYELLDKRSKETFNQLHYIVGKGGTNNKILNIWFSNCLGIQLHDHDPEDKGLFLMLSLTNHSCAANCIINFTDDKRLKLVAVTPIRRGEEVVVNYLHHQGGLQNLLRHERQRALRTMFQFSCECRVCSLSGQQLATNQSLKNQLRDLLAQQAACPCPSLTSSSSNPWDPSTTTEQVRKEFSHNIKKKLVIESALIEIMTKLGTEMVRDISPSYHRCYLYSKLLQLTGVGLNTSPEDFRRSARDGAAILGDSHSRFFRSKDQEYFQTIHIITSQIVYLKRFVLDHHIFTSAVKLKEPETQVPEWKEEE